MHELSIAISVVQGIESLDEVAGAERISRVHLRVGTLSGVDVGALELVLPHAAHGTRAEDATWHIDAVRAAVVCRACGRESEPETGLAVCEHCGSTDVEIVRGRELVIEDITLTEDH